MERKFILYKMGLLKKEQLNQEGAGKDIDLTKEQQLLYNKLVQQYFRSGAGAGGGAAPWALKEELE